MLKQGHDQAMRNREKEYRDGVRERYRSEWRNERLKAHQNRNRATEWASFKS